MTIYTLMARKPAAQKPSSVPLRVRSVSIVHLTPGDFKSARLNGLKPACLPYGALKTRKCRSKTVTAVLISAPLKTAFPFTQVLAGANAAMGPKDGLELSLQVKDERGWSPWFEFGRFSPGGGNASVKDQSNRFGRMETDTLILSSACRCLRYRVTLRTAPGSEAFLRLVSVTYTAAGAPYDETFCVNKPPSFKPVRLDVPEFSQMTQPAAYAGDICSPTSVAMILSHYGQKTRALEAASGVLDAAGRIYGNWTFNTMYAGSKGLYAWPARFNSLEEARGYLAIGIPLAASVTFGPGELKRSPLNKTTGHLLVIKGFDAKGDIIANDPAAAGERTVERVYSRKDFAGAWLKNKLGTAYIIAPLTGLPLTARCPLAELFSKPLDPKKNDGSKFIESQILPFEHISYAGARGAWLKIDAPEQHRGYGSEEKAPVPYPGWMEAGSSAFRHPCEPDAVVKNKKAALEDSNVPELSIGSRVKILGWEKKIFARVALPGEGAALINLKDLNFLPILAKAAELRGHILKTARQFLDDKYYWGGRSGRGIDCSGLVNISYRVWGIDLPRNACDQYHRGRAAARDKLEPADLIFSTKEHDHKNINHVMLYAGGGKIIEATQETGSVREVAFKVKFGLDFRHVKNGQVINGRKIYFRKIIGG